MNWKEIKWRLRYAWQYWPFTLNTLVCALAGWGAYKILYKPTPKGEDPSYFLPFIIIMGKMVLLLIAAIIAISILSTFVSYFYYLWLRSSNGTKLAVNFSTETRPGKANKLYLNTQMEGVVRPILGFVKGRLYYDDHHMTDSFSLLSNKRREHGMWRKAIAGRSRLDLPDIKEYNMKGGFVYFQDMLHLFSLAAAQPINGHFYQPPVLLEETQNEVYPRKTEQMDVRIDQLRRVEGEHLNYKDFEAGDDVRRIVWKVYAKNKELVVRVPELYEPYASHMYMYASFYAAVKPQWLGEGYLKEMLNYYKNCTWTVYDALSRKEWEMRYVPDLQFNIPEQLSEAELAARIITNSNWHKDKPLTEYFNARNGTVLCISSLTDTEELKHILDRCDAGTIIYFVQLSHALRHFAPFNWIQRILFLSPKDRLSRLKTTWTFSPIRVQIQRREKEIEDLLAASSVTWGVL